jgi:hypothetical protein
VEAGYLMVLKHSTANGRKFSILAGNNPDLPIRTSTRRFLLLEGGRICLREISPLNLPYKYSTSPLPSERMCHYIITVTLIKMALK